MRLVLTYDENLDTASVPAPGAFAVTVAGNPRTVSSVAVSGMAVTLTLPIAVAAADAVTLSYTVPTGRGRRCRFATAQATTPRT